MKKRSVIKTALLLAVAAYAAKRTLEMGREWQREDRIRAMSDEPPLRMVALRLLRRALVAEGPFFAELATFAKKIPLEVARYLKIESM